MNLALTMAMSGYEHIRDLAAGTVRVEGVDLTALTRRSRKPSRQACSGCRR